ncbi:MAG: GNAT family N-acetyltransferase [Anaerolineales bacterium]
MNLRQTSSEDRAVVEGLIAHAPWSHVHLDWLDPTNLIDQEPFILASSGDSSVGMLGCPPDLPQAAWVRTFAAAEGYDVDQVWQILWTEADSRLHELNVENVAALALENWFAQLVQKVGFKRTNAVIFYELELDLGSLAQIVNNRPAYKFRSIRSGDAETILELDQLAFEPIWQLSRDSLAVAINQASSASLIEDEGEILGYQITTSSPFGAHLARLAVLPSHQRKGLGAALIIDAVQSVQEIGLGQLSVNTQENNHPSRRLYEKMGFRKTGKEFPVFELQL